VERSGSTRRSRDAIASSASRSTSSSTTPATRSRRPPSSRSVPPSPTPRSPAEVRERIAVPGFSEANGARSASASVAA
jgi:hypothetical protein